MVVLSKCPRQSHRFPLSLHKTYSKQTHLWLCSNTRSKKMNVKTQNFRLGTTISGLKIDPDNSRWSIDLKTAPSSRLRTCICKRLMSSDQTGMITDKVRYHKKRWNFLNVQDLNDDIQLLNSPYNFQKTLSWICLASFVATPITLSLNELSARFIYSLHHPLLMLLTNPSFSWTPSQVQSNPKIPLLLWYERKRTIAMDSVSSPGRWSSERARGEDVHENRNRSHVERMHPKSNIDFKNFCAVHKQRRHITFELFRQFCKGMITDT